MPSFHRRHLTALAALSGAGLWPALSKGQAPAFPSRPVSFVVPYAAGGASDVAARLINAEMSRRLGQPVVVENVAGVGGSLGVQKFLAAPADGHTLLYGSLSETILVPTINPTAPYKPDDLLPVALTGRTPVAFIARQDFPGRTMDDLIAEARRAPGRLSYGSPGIGTFQHVLAETLKERAGVFMVHIPYRGGQQIVTDVMGGQIDIGVTSVPNVASMAGNGRFKVLGISSAGRSPMLPDVPGFSETKALKGLDLQTWGMVFVHPRTPPAVVAQLNAVINEVLQLPAVREARTKGGSELAAPLSPAAALNFYRTERDLYRPIGQRIKPE
jgi:tripartite-type tricarboxylate transporter receptor subunit TctC